MVRKESQQELKRLGIKVICFVSKNVYIMFLQTQENSKSHYRAFSFIGQRKSTRIEEFIYVVGQSFHKVESMNVKE